MKVRNLWFGLLLAGGAAMTAWGCGGSKSDGAKNQSQAQSEGTEGPDQSRCEWQGRTDREVIESRGPGALMPNVRRVYGIVGDAEERRRVLLCREIDTDLDGKKDVVRRYNEKGEALEEQADSDYDGRVDTWIRFARGRMSKVEIDSNRDGRPDETRFYVKGDISRIQRDTNSDGKPDVWEIYSGGRLERMGKDVDYDGHVDRWERDEIARRLADIKEREAEEERERAKAAKSADGGAEDYVSPRAR